MAKLFINYKNGGSVEIRDFHEFLGEITYEDVESISLIVNGSLRKTFVLDVDES